MKFFISKTISFFLAALILFSTSSFTVDMHYCCNQLVDIGVWSKAKTCTEKVQKTDSPFKRCTSIQEKDCCSNQTLVKTGADTLEEAQTQLEFEDILFPIAICYTYLNLFEGLEENIVPFKHYRPPLLFKDIQVLDETYLI